MPILPEIDNSCMCLLDRYGLHEIALRWPETGSCFLAKILEMLLNSAPMDIDRLVGLFIKIGIK